MNKIYIKRHLFHQSKLERDVELQKNPHSLVQVTERCYTLTQQLGLGSQLKEWYQDATSVPYGHLLTGLTPKTVDSLRCCSNSGSVPTLASWNRDQVFGQGIHNWSLFFQFFKKIP